MATTPQAAGAVASAKPGARAWFVLGVLCFVYVLNFLDRQLLSILAKPIQDDLGVTDGQIGLITGLYFALFYCTISIPVGWLADRTNRVKLVAVACGLWSAATIACGVASNYPQLVAARMAVGVGEAGGVPPSYAIISDYFGPGTRGTALGFFNVGPALGQMLGVAFGASIAAAYDWRSAFIAIGAVGVVTAVLVFFTVKEPKRGGLDAAPVAAEPPEGFWKTCAMFFSRPVLRLTALAGGATQFVTYALLNFATLFLMREKGMTLQQVALWYALVIGIAGGGGIFLAGRLADWLVPKTKRAYAWLPAVSLTLAVPFFIGFVWAPTWQLSLLFLTVPMFLNYFYLSPSVALVQEEVKPHQRVLSGALLLLVMNMIGLGFGPTYLGAISDWFKATNPDNSLQMALYTLVFFYGLAVVLYLFLARALGREEAATKAGVAA
ncbi:MFS transporter [Caulobacter sp. SLTY]|uniref:spinster family MFS transporter n=1 Tax=Caulobacter sp. SLTY TaxID=2683262 RepID=UPI001411C7DF|nr:MFS transporter [Caulobacter sp. SLTY]NBB16523.1 MFS transporter [Caulobacter sp. SLTY]